MCEACLAYGCRKPKYEIVPGGITLTLYTRESMVRKQNGGVNDGVKLTNTEKEILKVINEYAKVTYTELSNSLSISEATITRAIRHHKKIGLLIRRGSDKDGYWEVASAAK